MASRVSHIQVSRTVCVVAISMLLHGRNRATDALQLVIGIFLSSSGASRRVVDTFNRMGLSVSYQTVQRSLKTLTKSAQEGARSFVLQSQRLWGIVYDNINFTLRKASQRLDNMTEQLNATTSAVFSLPSKFSRTSYGAALSIVERNRLAGRRSLLSLDDLRPTTEQQGQLVLAFKHHVRSILLSSAPGLSKHNRFTKALRKETKKRAPRIRVLSSEKTEFFPLPALAQEEASVQGTIKVVTKLFKDALKMVEGVIDFELRLLVGDWLSIRNLRLMKDEVSYELTAFARMGWVQEVSMPFHFQLNAMYMIFRTHLGHPGDLEDPSSLEHHRKILRRSKLDTKKPEYNRAKELVDHSLTARVVDCARPSWEEFDSLVDKLVREFTSTAAAHKALLEGDEVLGHAILFNCDALMFREFSEAVRGADVGRMWLIYDFWVFMMRGAGCHNYGNEILEMKAQFQYELPPLLREVVERTWLVNRWGKKGRSIPTDLYLEHNNGFLKVRPRTYMIFTDELTDIPRTQNMFAAMGSNASMEHIVDKSSACVEVLRGVAHDVATFFGVNDYHRGHHEVNAQGDLKALLVDLAAARVHTFSSGRHVPPPPTRSSGQKQTQTKRTTSVLLTRSEPTTGESRQ
ncbi:hypothetical protein C2E23DRAFT_716977 [Lenzites betulinus]|nr:hypothetical protein C2E23DRAFT_716977 [Lenzites betulinus]